MERTPLLLFRNTVAVLGILGTGQLTAAEYYLTPGGSDANPGTHARPWKTINKANNTLQPGDTVYIMNGEYQNKINPANSGEASRYITYRAYPGHAPVITAPPGRVAILLQNRSYIRIDGIKVDGKKPYDQSNIDQWAVLDNAHYNIVQNSEFKYAKGWNGFHLISSHYNKILNNRIDYAGTYYDPNLGEGAGDSVALHCANHNVLEGNYLTRGGHNLLHASGDYNVIRNNVFDNSWSATTGYRAISLTANRQYCASAVGYNLFEDNVIRNSKGTFDDRENASMKVEGTGQIVRYNIYHDNIGAAMSGGIRPPRITEVRSNKIYNNVVVNSAGLWIIRDYDNPGAANNNVFKNNVVYRSHDHTGLSINFTYTGRSPMEDNYFIANAFAEPSGVGSFKIDGIGTKTLDWLQTNNSIYFKNNVQSLPEFVSEDPEDSQAFRLATGSPLVDGGDFLTKTTAAGSGKVVSVADAGWFTDGFDVVSGDYVKVGKNAPVKVTNVDYSGNKLVLESSISWGAGIRVSLPYEGAAPDIGAYEYRNEGLQGPAVPTNVQIVKQ